MFLKYGKKARNHQTIKPSNYRAIGAIGARVQTHISDSNEEWMCDYKDVTWNGKLCLLSLDDCVFYGLLMYGSWRHATHCRYTGLQVRSTLYA